ncbi:MAG: hypothetical protein NVSMB64_00410 [Candidatus Velthaea sp.]
MLDELFALKSESLVDVSVCSIAALARAFGIDTPMVRSSSLAVPGDRNDRLLRLCEHFGATRYLSGKAAEVYLDVPRFERAGIEVAFQNYEHPVYAQTREPFVSHLSALDALLNLGPDARELIGLKKSGAGTDS